MTTQFKDQVERCLGDLENRINPAVEDALSRQWIDFLEGRFKGDIFSPVRTARSEPGFKWPAVTVNQSQDDFDAMLIREMSGCSSFLDRGKDGILSVRSNYGTGILPSLFGAEMFIMDESLNTLPTTRPLDGLDAIRAILDAGVPDLRSGLGGKVLEMGARHVEVGKRHPKIGKYVNVYHPDLQSPMDATELLWGSGMFVDLFDHPDMVHGLLKLVTETYTLFMREWEKIVPPRTDGYSSHWGLLQKGRIMLRDDSAMNLSPEMYDEFIRPYNGRLLKTFGGGAVHFCGRGDHFIASASGMEGLNEVNLSQPHLNNMDIIFSNTVDRGINLFGLDRTATESALKSGRNLRHRVHCW